MKRSLILVGSMLVPVACLWSPSCWAFKFSPMVATLSSSGPEATQTFLVENNNGEKIGIEIDAFHRDVDIEGKETRRETEEFAIFPQQLVMEPGEKRNIRLTWTGDKELKSELPYRLVVSQVPVNLKKPEQRKSGANITFLLQYVASIYVSPGAAAPKIQVESFKASSDGTAELVLENSGTAHRVLKGMHVYLKPEGVAARATASAPASSRRELSPEQMKEFEAENILPGSARRFALKIPKELKGAGVEVEFDSQ